MSQKSKLSIIPAPDTIFIVELDEYLLLTTFPIEECIFPIYKIDNTKSVYDDAFNIAEDIAIKVNKLVVNAVDFPLDDPMIYDPIEINKQMSHLMAVFKEERSKIQ